MNRLFQFLILLISFLSLNSKGQTFELGPLAGYGVFDYEKIPVLPYYKCYSSGFPECYKIGITGNYTFKSSFFSIKTGLTFTQLLNTYYYNSAFEKLKIIQIPVGIDLRLGKRYYGLAGAGFAMNCILAKPSQFYIYPTFQFGLIWNLGFGYRINQLMSLDFCYQYEYDLTTLYGSLTDDPLTGSYYKNHRSYNRIFYLNLRFIISEKKLKS